MTATREPTARSASRGDVFVSCLADILFASTQLNRVLICRRSHADRFWYSLAKRYTSYTQAFLGLAMAVARRRLVAAVGPRAPEPWRSGSRLGSGRRFDISSSMLEFARAIARLSIPSASARATLGISRMMHVATIACMTVLGSSCRSPVYFVGVVVAALLFTSIAGLGDDCHMSSARST